MTIGMPQISISSWRVDIPLVYHTISTLTFRKGHCRAHDPLGDQSQLASACILILIR